MVYNAVIKNRVRWLRFTRTWRGRTLVVNGTKGSCRVTSAAWSGKPHGSRDGLFCALLRSQHPELESGTEEMLTTRFLNRRAPV